MKGMKDSTSSFINIHKMNINFVQANK
jgi:hypothetical protein